MEYIILLKISVGESRDIIIFGSRVESKIPFQNSKISTEQSMTIILVQCLERKGGHQSSTAWWNPATEVKLIGKNYMSTGKLEVKSRI